MNKTFINHTVLGISCLFLMACGQAKNGSAAPDAAVSESQVEATASAATWQSIYFDWAAGEVYPETACAEGRVTLKSNGTLEVRDCGEIRRAKINDSELADIERQLDEVISALDNPIRCNGDAIADYAQNWKLVDGSGQTIQVYRFNIENTCGRVSNLDQLNDSLFVLREKYFPRVEEGVYE